MTRRRPFYMKKESTYVRSTRTLGSGIIPADVNRLLPADSRLGAHLSPLPIRPVPGSMAYPEQRLQMDRRRHSLFVAGFCPGAIEHADRRQSPSRSCRRGTRCCCAVSGRSQRSRWRLETYRWILKTFFYARTLKSRHAIAIACRH